MGYHFRADFQGRIIFGHLQNNVTLLFFSVPLDCRVSHGVGADWDEE